VSFCVSFVFFIHQISKRLDYSVWEIQRHFGPNHFRKTSQISLRHQITVFYLRMFSKDICFRPKCVRKTSHISLRDHIAGFLSPKCLFNLSQMFSKDIMSFEMIYIWRLSRWYISQDLMSFEMIYIWRLLKTSLQHTATHCNTLQHTATDLYLTSLKEILYVQNVLMSSRKTSRKIYHLERHHLERRQIYIWRLLKTSLQHTATHCNTLQHTATHCNRYISDVS